MRIKIHISLLIIIISFVKPSAQDTIIIKQLSVEQGLSDSYTRSVFKDKDGYMWFSTQVGIERYDGQSFLSFNYNPDDTSSFINSFAYNFYEDRDGILWISTFHGLEKFNRLTNSFTHYLPESKKINQTYVNYVWNMLEDERGIFFVSAGTGIYKFDKKSEKFTKLQFENPDSADNLHNNYGPLLLDKEGSLWYGNSQGLNKFNYKTGKFIHIWRDPNPTEKNYSTISKYQVCSIIQDNGGILWLGTTDGLVEFDPKINTFSHYLPQSNEPAPLYGNHVNKLFMDLSGKIWLGTANGIYVFDKNSKRFLNHYNVGNNIVIDLFIDMTGILWATTFGTGVYEIFLEKLPFKKFFTNGLNNIVDGKNGILWVDTSSGKWVKFDTKTYQVVPHSLGSDFLIAVDDSGSMWFYNKEGNIYKLNKKNKRVNYYDNLGNKFTQGVVTHYETNEGIWFGDWSGSLYFLDFKTHIINLILKKEVWITAIYKDSFDLIWVSTYMGSLLCYDQKNEKITEFFSDSKNPTSLSGKFISSIYEDKEKRLWFATDFGLNMFDRLKKSFIHYTEKDGLVGNIVYNVLEDDERNLWLHTNKGISKFFTKTIQFKNYNVLRNSPSRTWSYRNLAIRMKNGEMFFGRSNGLISFYPDSIKDNPFIPPIVISSFRLFDKPIPFGEKINLPYDQNFLSFEFAALSYINPERNQYAYKMEGVDKNWVYSGTRRYASYPNLAPGEYTFRVKGSNNDGVWNEKGTSLSIIISPPWWKTNWAYAAYGLFLLFVLYSVRRYELNRVELKNKIKLDEVVLKEREETDKIKSRFFANISHEFRTPLTLILGPAEKISTKTTDESIIKDTGIIKRNSKRLLQLVNQLLDLSKLEAGKLKLEASKNNIVSFVKGITLSFESLSEEKDITLKIESEKEFIEVYFDKEKMIKILSNILSNSFKFTPKNGKIIVSINSKPPFHSPFDKGGNPSLHAPFVKGRTEAVSIEIKIRDTGIGIPKEEIPKLFDRFYQVDSFFTKEFEGTGIGLALTKELVELHHGSIFVKSEMGKWTEFTIILPLGKDHLKNEEILPEEKAEKSEINIEKEKYYVPQKVNGESNEEIEINHLKEDKTIVLIVEDNYDMREYIKESLNNSFIIEEADNGEQGIRKAIKIIPDLIISDMMMPKMDGNEMTRILKNDEKTSHIPIIILTAKSGHESKLEGLQTGADDYLTKPFDIKELQIRIENLIKIRKKLQEKFSRIDIKKSEIAHKKLSTIDEKFMIKVREVIEKHIAEENFSIEDFGNELSMSRMQIHRKLKALTGKSASRYIRSFRLERAKEILSERNENISEVAYSLGFGSPAYFTRCFKEEFGYSPSDLKS